MGEENDNQGEDDDYKLEVVDGDDKERMKYARGKRTTTKSRTMTES